MQLNKPKYSLVKNFMYAIDGLVEIGRHESSFKIELIGFIVFGVIAWSLPMKFIYSSVLFISLFIPILAEIINSAIERVVDLATTEHKPLAKQAKDVGAALVLVGLIVVMLIWIFVLIIAFT